MNIITFISQFGSKPKLHNEVWWNILIKTGEQKISIDEIILKCKTSKSTFYRIFNEYNTKLEDSDCSLLFRLKNRVIIIEKESLTPSVNKINEQPPTVKKSTKAPQLFPTEELQKPQTVEPSTKINLPKIIINYLNEKSGKDYKNTSKTYIAYINKRIKDGYSLEDFKHVIDVKCSKWLGTSQEDYLRPETLFGGKFESYLNENITSSVVHKKDKLQKAYDTIKKATEHDWNFDSKS